MMLFDRLISLYLTMMGIIPIAKYKKYENHLFTILISCDLVTLTAMCIAYVNAESSIHKSALLSVIAPTLGFFLHRFIGYTKRKQLASIMENFQSTTHLVDNRIESKTKIKLMSNFTSFVVLIFISLTISAIPYTNFFTSQSINFDDPDLYVIPYLFHYWNVNSVANFVFLTAMQNVTVTLLSGTYFSFIAFVIYVLSNIEAHIDELNQQLNEVIDSNIIRFYCNKNEKSFGWIPTAKTEQSYPLLRKRYLTDFTKYLDTFLSVYVMIFISAAFFLTIELVEVIILQLSTDTRRFIAGLLTLILALYGFYIWCYVGETINHLDENIQQSLYLSRWYMLPVEIRELLVITMIHAHEEVKITVFGISKINFSFYVHVIKIFYSVVNIMYIKTKNV